MHRRAELVMSSLRKALARDRARAKAIRPRLHGGSIRRVYPDAVRKAARRRSRKN